MIRSFEIFFGFFLFIYFVAAEVNDRYYPRYHLAPPHGWMNDPNGFSVFKGEYHLFYQYNPESSLEPGIAHWGHAKSTDLFNWEHLPIAMYPDEWFDKSGVFSGGALIENDTMYLFYTGNLNRPGQIPDHEEYQALAISTDGVTVTKSDKNPIIYGADRQPDVRDPKVWKHEDTYYMVLGNSFNNNTLGRVLLYASDDMISWKEVSILVESDGFLGFMHECADFFELDGYFVLLFSPQGLKPKGDKYRNLFQTGYIVGDFDYDTNKFTPLTKFRELDHGHDFYTTQTILDDAGRRLFIAWFDTWDPIYPERQDGWAGLMTIPRELSLKDGLLIQKPVSEVAVARGKSVYSLNGCPGTFAIFEDNAGEITIEASQFRDFELTLDSPNGQAVLIKYDAREGRVTLDRGGKDGVRRTKWRPHGKLQMKIFMDASSIELFCGEGEVTFSSRFFPNGPVTARISGSSCADTFRIHSMKRTVPKPNRPQDSPELIFSQVGRKSMSHSPRY